jgi:hypothetical protein
MFHASEILTAEASPRSAPRAAVPFHFSMNAKGAQKAGILKYEISFL